MLPVPLVVHNTNKLRNSMKHLAQNFSNQQPTNWQTDQPTNKQIN